MSGKDQGETTLEVTLPLANNSLVSLRAKKRDMAHTYN